MTFIADLHIHSKYSRATSRNLDLETLYVKALEKGITVIGTGDATHPGWLSELTEKLVPAEDGLFRLRRAIESTCLSTVPPICRGEVRFMLCSEISCIYKKHGKTRKNHNLVYFPDMESVERFNASLETVGNIRSDGRPILGMDARNLLETVLETHHRAYLVPAHIWTPWFSMLGSKSGFDNVEDCFGDLSSEVFAVETGLSSDPAMNRRVSFLDRFTLVSSSDAHSPDTLGREATVFDTELSYDGIRNALMTGNAGTLEFFPEQGKYHNDGHRKCGVNLTPGESAALSDRCPVCGGPLTLGVSHRIGELADRSTGEIPNPQPSFHSLIPLADILSEILGKGSRTKGVAEAAQTLIRRFGPELDILRVIPPDDLAPSGIPCLGEAIARMRAGRLSFRSGYDGEYGTVQLFTDDETHHLPGASKLGTIRRKSQMKHALPVKDTPS